MTRKLSASYEKLYKGCAVGREGLLMRFCELCELRDYPNRSYTPLRTYHDSGLQSDRRYVYTRKVGKEIGQRSKQTSETVTEAPTRSRGSRNPIGMGHVIPTGIRIPTVT